MAVNITGNIFVNGRTTVRGPNLFNPLDLSGCVLWLDAQDESTITYGVGTRVSTWTDKSTSGIVFNDTGLTPNVPDVVSSSSFSDKNALRFLNAERLRSNSSSLSNINVAESTWFFVMASPQASSITSPTSHFVVFRFNDDSTNTAKFVINPFSYYGSIPSTTVGASQQTPAKAVGFDMNWAADEGMVVSYTIDTVSTSTIWKNNTNQTPTVTSGTGTFSPNTQSYTTLGALLTTADGLVPPHSDLACIVVYNRILTSLERTQVVNGLTSRYM